MENLTEQLNKVEEKLTDLLKEIQSDDSLYFAQQYYAIYRELNLMKQYCKEADLLKSLKPKSNFKEELKEGRDIIKAYVVEKNLKPVAMVNFFNGVPDEDTMTNTLEQIKFAYLLQKNVDKSIKPSTDGNQ